MFKKSKLNYVFALVGALLAFVGLYLIFMYPSYPYSGIVFGMGGGLCGLSFSNIYYMKNPEFAKIKDVEENDERNKFIRYKTGSQVNRITSAAVVILAVVVGRSDVPSWISFVLSGVVLLDAVSYILLFARNKKSN